MKTLTSNWQGSIATLSMVAQQIEERFGQEAVKLYDPQINCFTFNGWKERGYSVKKGEKAIRSITMIEPDDETKKKYIKTVNLFFIDQVQKVTQ